MSHDHSHVPAGAHERPMWFALALTGSFLVIEIIGGVLTGSLALISDAAHMFTDTVALAIALGAIRIAQRPADARRTFGYYRFEILAASFNAAMLFLAAGYIAYEAYRRLLHPLPVQSLPMLVIASVGLGVNFFAMRLLASGQSTSLNVKGAYLEVWSDMLGSLGVIVGAVVIQVTAWRWVDPVIALGIAFWVLPRTWKLQRQSLNILLEGVPEGLELSAIEITLLEGPGVSSVHDLHVWAIGSGKVSLTAHLVCALSVDADALMRRLRDQLAHKFHIHHTTLQCETAPCIDDSAGRDCVDSAVRAAGTTAPKTKDG